jgi:DNA-binding response OmpR family regulator
MQKKILLLEDDPAINRLLTSQLSTEGFKVLQCYDGEEAITQFDESIDLALLDIMVPKKDGLKVLEEIRKKSVIPVLFLTAKEEEVDKVLALGLGADDYITKPFSMIEVVYRIKAHLRRFYSYNRAETNEAKIYTNGDLTINTLDYVAQKGDEVLDLSIKEFELLAMFMKNLGQVFTKIQLYETVWEEDYYGDDNTIMVHISRLREKIGDSSKSPTYIRTIKGLGYRMEKLCD